MSQKVIHDKNRYRFHSKDTVDGTIYYTDLKTGNVVYIGTDGEMVKA